MNPYLSAFKQLTVTECGMILQH